MVEAIKPTDVAETKAATMPDAVITAWNNIIAKNFSNGRACVRQNDIIATLMPHTKDGQSAQVFAEGWLDIEEIYRAQGWEVVYNKPAYSETGIPTFIFKAKE